MNSIDLNGTWELLHRPMGDGVGELLHEPLTAWDDALSASVPGEVHLDLLRHGIIDEPFYDRNVDACRWVEEKEWWFRRIFVIEALHRDHVELVCDGLDTDAILWLNGTELGRAANAFIDHRFEVTHALRPGKNTLVVRLDAGVSRAKEKPLERYGKGASESIWVRKPQFSFGWDWAPRLVNCGIWRPIHMEVLETVTLRDVWVRTTVDADHSADVRVIVEVENISKKPVNAQLSLVIPEVGDIAIPLTAIPPGLHRIEHSFHADAPRLWWPTPLGDATLHTLHSRLEVDGALLDEREVAFGIREITLVETPIEGVEGGTTFTLKVNGENFFANGANWAPSDGILPRITGERYEQLLTMALEANINMFRVWGGGIYEDEAFYRFCDEHGILIWHDFMFACFIYPGDDEAFRNTVEEEVTVATRRLRNHPSIALWCGSNETDWAFDNNWYSGLEKNYSAVLEHELIPSLMKDLDPDRPYRPTSPWGGKEVNDEDAGDQHWWALSIATGGNDTLDYRHYRRCHCTFNSEYGYFGIPPIASIRDYLPKEAQHIDSPAFRHHTNDHGFMEKGGKGRLKVQVAVDALVGDADDMTLEQLVDASQLLQAEALKAATEQARRRKGACGGSMFWMFCDSWGEVGWSVVDYYLRKKASYYAVKRAYAPVLVSIKEEETGVSVWVINDTLDPVSAQLDYGLVSFDGKTHTGFSATVEIPPNASVRCADERMTLMRSGDFYFARLTAGETLLSENVFHFMNFKSMKLLPATVLLDIVDQTPETATIELSTDNFAHYVHLTLPDGITPEDNFFDILPGSRRRVGLVGSMDQLPAMQLHWRNRPLAVERMNHA